tara:strand:- start:80533 stop:81108 length:576 start_codon:yes stop_codon:yes gene_type:complete
MDTFYFNLGLTHVLDVNALDHLLFLTALSLPFSLNLFKKLFFMVTFFTVGHTLSLLINYFYQIPLNTYLVEILIPITISITCLPLIINKFFNMINFNKFLLNYFCAIFFGVIHGFGFSNFFFNIVREDSTISNLIEFAMGIEVAQIIIVSIVIFLNFLAVKIFNVKTFKIQMIIGIIILIMSGKMLYENII